MTLRQWLLKTGLALYDRLLSMQPREPGPTVTVQRYVIWHRPHTDSRVKLPFGSSLDVMDSDDLDTIADDVVGSPGWMSDGTEIHTTKEGK
jgi:hypothetical protein